MVEKIEAILNEVLPAKAYRLVANTKSIFGDPQIKIVIAVSDYQINGVKGQLVQVVSLLLWLNDMEIYPQVFGGNGGQFIFRKPNMNDPKEKYLAMKSIKIPFRKPKQEENFVLGAIKRFAENWVRLLRENREELMYQEYVNYDEILNS